MPVIGQRRREGNTRRAELRIQDEEEMLCCVLCCGSLFHTHLHTGTVMLPVKHTTYVGFCLPAALFACYLILFNFFCRLCFWSIFVPCCCSPFFILLIISQAYTHTQNTEHTTQHRHTHTTQTQTLPPVSSQISAHFFVEALKVTLTDIRLKETCERPL